MKCIIDQGKAKEAHIENVLSDLNSLITVQIEGDGKSKKEKFKNAETVFREIVDFVQESISIMWMPLCILSVNN